MCSLPPCSHGHLETCDLNYKKIKFISNYHKYAEREKEKIQLVLKILHTKTLADNFYMRMAKNLQHKRYTIITL